MELEGAISNKVKFLIEIRDWLNSKAIRGHAYVRLSVRREWTAWANRRIKYFLRKLEEAT